MENSWVLVMAVAVCPLAVASLTWAGFNVANRFYDRRRMLSSMGPAVVRPGPRRLLARMLVALAVAVGLVHIVASMSPPAAWSLGGAGLAMVVLVMVRGAVEPEFGIDEEAFDRVLRTFLDEDA